MIISRKALESKRKLSSETLEVLNNLGIDADECGNVKITVNDLNKDFPEDYSIEFDAKLDLSVKDDKIFGVMKSYFDDKPLVFSMVGSLPVERFLSEEFYPFVSKSVKELKTYLAYSSYSLYDFFNVLARDNGNSNKFNNNYMLIIVILRGFLFIGDLLNKILNKLSTK